MKKFTLTLRKSGFSSISFPISSLQLELGQKIVFHKIITQLFIELIKEYGKNEKVFVLCRFQYEDESFRTLHKGRIITLNNKNQISYLRFILETLDLKSNNYNLVNSEVPIKNIHFDFFKIPKGSEGKYVKWEELDTKKEVRMQKFSVNEGDYLLPLNRNYRSWGKAIFESENVLIIQVEIEDMLGTVSVTKEDSSSRVKFYKGKQTIEFVDSPYKDKIFVRKFMSGEQFYIKNSKGELVLKSKPIKTEFLKKLATSNTINSKIGTLDIETIVKDGVHKPYLFAFYDGNRNKVSTWFTDKSNDFFDLILTRKFTGYTIYAHNLSRFDVVFLFKNIAELSSKGFKVDIVKKEDKIISIKISNRSKNISVTLKDSYLLLPMSLAKLSKQFNLKNGKSIEPVYIGNDPDYVDYKSSDLSHYSKDVEQFNSFIVWKERVEAYCINDCVVLYQVIQKFQELIFNKFAIDIVKYPTTPSLAYAIYRTHYLEEGIIPITEGDIFNYIKGSYTGGSTEMYKPYALNKNIYCYDVNSLYPAVMANNLYPTGSIFQFEGDPTILDNYWIGDATVESKTDLYQPYLQIHHKTSAGYRTIAPNGKFNMVIHSTEYENALKDYNISISKGYLFEKQSNIFCNYVQDMYKLRQEYSKDQPMNLIAKLLLNSLYGRFGMQPQLHSHIFANFSEVQELCTKFEIIDYIEIDKDLYFVTYESEDSNELDSSFSKNSGVSVSIASAVTAYARVYMSQFKNNQDYNLFYTDTDSIFVDKELNSSLVNSGLGNMKLEYKLTDSIFLAPKVYAGITDQGKKICKVKGFTNSSQISLNELENLLDKGSVKSLTHTKWFRNLFDSKITMRNTPYNLVQTDNKRELIYDSSGRAIDTKAFKLD